MLSQNTARRLKTATGSVVVSGATAPTAGQILTATSDTQAEWQTPGSADVGSAIHGATAKTTPVDADTTALIDSADSNTLKKLSWANIKATLKTYFDTLYAAALGTDDNYVTDAEKTKLANLSGTNTGDQTLPTRDSLGLDTNDTPEFDGVVIGSNAGIDLSPGSDVNTDIITVNVTGTPKIWWDESMSRISFTDTYFYGNVGFDDSVSIGELTVSSVNIGNVDTTITRVSAGVVAVEGVNVLTVAGGTMTGNIDMGGQDIVDVHELRLDAIPDTDHTANGLTTNSINAGATIAIGNCVYLGSGGKWVLADADATATADALLAIALEAKNDTEAMLVALPGSIVRDDTWNWTVGGRIFLSTTAGELTQTAPSGTDDVVRVVGYAISADVMFFLPEGGVVHA